MSKEQKRRNKTKAELEHEMNVVAATKRKRQFVKDVFYPILVKHSQSINQAKNMCRILESDIMSTFNEPFAKTKLKDLKLAEKLEEENGDGVQAYKALLEAFADLPLPECMELISGMPGAIDGFLNEENKTRTLEGVKTHFL